MKNFNKIIIVILSILFLGCSITVPPKPETHGRDKYPTKSLQLQYDNFMLGRLKYYEDSEDIDLITIAFIDSRMSNNKKYDEYEEKVIKEAISQEKLYFTVGRPLYNPETGKEVSENEMFLGVPTSNPLDYMATNDIKRWKDIVGAYVSIEDARIGFSKIVVDKDKAHLDPWGIIEVDFVPLRYGRPLRVVKAWKWDPRAENEFNPENIHYYKLDSSICKLLNPIFKIIYVQ